MCSDLAMWAEAWASARSVPAAGVSSPPEKLSYFREFAARRLRRYVP
ncbi:hypothetical protein [Nocardia cyriacigeorgica]|nr:hypothetical protein [Nocardia cyriacigeorgica]